MFESFDRDSYETLILFMWVTGLWASVCVACLGACIAVYKLKHLYKMKPRDPFNLYEQEVLSDTGFLSDHSKYQSFN